MMKRKLFFCLFCTVSAAFSQWSDLPDSPVWLGSGVQAQARAASDGVYVAWLSDGNYHVYLQRLTMDGTPQWNNGGMVVSDQPNQSWIAVHHMNLAIDGQDNAIISTLDSREGVWQVYVYKISPEGTMLWGEDGLHLSVSGSENISPRLTVLTDNSIVVAWCENYSTVRLQKISEDGSLDWGDGGIHLVDETGDLMNPIPLTAGGTNVLIQWNHQSGPFWAPDCKLHIQKFSETGVEVWNDPVVAAGPVQFPTGNYFQEFAVDEFGNSFSAWTEMTSQNQLAAVQRTNNTGEVLWGGGVDLSTNSSNFRTNPQITVAGSSSELLTAWTEAGGSQSQHGIYAQRLDADGNRLWGSNGIPIVPLNSNYSYLDLSVEGFIDDLVAVYIEQNTSMTGDIYASRLDAAGEFVWTEQTVTLTTSGNSKSDMSTGKGPGCVFVTWTENGSVYAHCLLEDGTLGPPVPQEIEIDIFHSADWNIVGLPIDSESASYSTIFPSALSGTLYGFDGGYYSTENLITGIGFWLRFDEEESTIITGTPLNEVTVNLNEGWNLITGISFPVEINSIVDIDGIIVEGTIYGYSTGGYTNPSFIEPGKGYWVRANASGSITLMIE